MIVSYPMKGITYCGACIAYDKKKHRCKAGACEEKDPRKPFYEDCPLPDVVSVKTYEATEQAYKNGYEQGKKDALKWIPVSERKPDFELVEAKANDFDLYACLCAKVITGRKNHVVTVKAWYDGTHFMDSDCIYITKSVTHWMPLPEPPKGEQV